MMKYEPLKNQKEKLKSKPSKESEENNYNSGFKKGVDESFHVFASYVDLYKRYKNDVKLLMNEEKNIWSKWVEYFENKSNIDKANYLDVYNNWLFDYVFSDVEGNSKSFLDL